MLFALKKDGSLRLCIDYHQLNKVTIKNKYPLLRIDDLFDQLQWATTFSKIDLQSGYHQFLVKEEDIPKTKFRTRYGHYQVFSDAIRSYKCACSLHGLDELSFRPYPDHFFIMFIDDILIYSKSRE